MSTLPAWMTNDALGGAAQLDLPPTGIASGTAPPSNHDRFADAAFAAVGAGRPPDDGRDRRDVRDDRDRDRDRDRDLDRDGRRMRSRYGAQCQRARRHVFHPFFLRCFHFVSNQVARSSGRAGTFEGPAGSGPGSRPWGLRPARGPRRRRQRRPPGAVTDGPRVAAEAQPRVELRPHGPQRPGAAGRGQRHPQHGGRTGTDP